VDLGLDFGRYRPLFKLASGGMAEVYAGLQTGEAGFTKVVAIKRMHAHLGQDEHFVTMFLDEARLAAAIRSPHVVSTVDVGRSGDGTPYLVMDLVIGVNLAELIVGALRAGQPMPRALGIEVLAQTALGLHDAHTATDPGGHPLGIIHRDVSPQNVLVGVDGLARLTDFGVAHALFRRTESEAGELKGKFAYFSPEQAFARPLDCRSDVFALAVVAWEFLAGQRLFRDPQGGAAVLELIKHKPIPRLSQVRPDLPPALVEVVARGLERDPARRFATAHDMALALRAAEGGGSHVPSRHDVARFLRSICGESIGRLEARLRAATEAARAGREPEAAAGPGRPSTDAAITELYADLAADPSAAATTPARPSGPGLRSGTSASPRTAAPGPGPVASAAGAAMPVPPSPSPPSSSLPSAAAPTTGGRGVWMLVAGALALATGVGATVAVLTRDRGVDAGPGATGGAPGRSRDIAQRACREWSRALAHFQKADGSFGIEAQRAATGHTTGQQLAALVHAHRACASPGPSPLQLGLRALDRFRTDDGYTGADRVETPATAWAVIALAEAAVVLGDPEARSALARARDTLLVGQRDDGSFRFLPRASDAPGNGVSTVMALWALVVAEPVVPGSGEQARAARARAAAWVRRALREDVGEPPLRATAGLQEQAAWVLRRSRALDGGADAGDAALLTQVGRDLVARCQPGGDGACTRPLYENGQTYLEHVPGKPPDYMTFWHPWATLAAHELGADAAVIPDGAVRAQLRAVAAWGVREIEGAVAQMTTAPGYKLSEYLFVASALSD
jgi:hypothetical protein